MIFSVVIPVYNVKDYLPKCIDSVLAQDFEDYEVILIDDGSTDRSAAIAEEHVAVDSRIHLICKPNTGGAPGAHPRHPQAERRRG